MGNYKKGILSVAAAIAISTNPLGADYLPLTNENFVPAGEWILYGVSGFKTDGAEASVAGTFSAGGTALTDAYDTDELFATEGLVADGNPLASLKVLGSTQDPITIQVNIADATFNETEPTRTIYVDTNADGVPDFAFTYKAQLEGKTLQYSVDSGSVYELTIDYANTYSAPAVGTLVEASGGDAGTQLSSLIDTAGSGTLLDYSFLDNPVSYSNFDFDTHGTAAPAPTTANYTRIYSYDANNGGLWNLFDSRYATNDFTTLDKGRGYWGKMALAAPEAAGLVLGSATVSATDYQALNITEGWNLVSFNNGSNSELREANTGLIVTFEATSAGETIIIKDSAGNQSVSVVVDIAGGETGVDVAKNINFAIAQAKALGTLQKTFDLKALVVDDATYVLALVSNKKFSIHDDATDAVIANAKTLTAAGLLINPTTEVELTASEDPDAEGVSSIYGEYAMVLDPAVGAGSFAGASADNNATFHIQASLEAEDPEDLYVTIENADTLTTLQGKVDALVPADGSALAAYEIDYNQDGTKEFILVASEQPFYIRDNTFTRIFTHTGGATGGYQIQADSGNIDFDSNTSAANAATVIRAAGGMAAASGTTLFIATDGVKDSEYTVYYQGTGTDNLDVLTSSSNLLAQGSVADVYSLSYLAKQTITNRLDLNASAIFAVSDDQNVTFTYTTLRDSNLTGTLVNTAGDSVAALQTQIESDLTNLNLGGTVEANATHITIMSSDIIALYSDVNATGTYEVNATASLGSLSSIGAGDLATDLKYNAVYAPNYVMDGPLYTMRDAGFDLKALVSGTMPMDGSATMQWESIDLTRKPSEWFDSQDYNLFDTDAQAGYWAYLELNGAGNPLSVTNVSIGSLDFTHYYDGATTTNIFSANIFVGVTGIDTSIDSDGTGGSKSARVTAALGTSGKEIELKRNSSGLYTGKISFYEAAGIDPDSALDIQIKVADGLGNKISVSAYDDFGIQLDNEKPAAPTATLSGTDITIGSTSTDVAAYYVFDTIIPEAYSADDEMLRLVNEPDGEVIGSGVCGNDVTIANPVGSLKVVAVDGDGEINAGNVSNVTSTPYMAIAKDRIVLSDDNNGQNDASVGGTPYSATCTAGTPVTTNDYALQLTSMTNAKTTKIAFEPLASGVDLTGVPITVYVTNADNDAVAKITYAPAYVDEEVFVMLNGKAYGYKLPIRATAEATGPGADATDITATVPGGLKDGVTF